MAARGCAFTIMLWRHGCDAESEASERRTGRSMDATDSVCTHFIIEIIFETRSIVPNDWDTGHSQIEACANRAGLSLWENSEDDLVSYLTSTHLILTLNRVI